MKGSAEIRGGKDRGGEHDYQTSSTHRLMGELNKGIYVRVIYVTQILKHFN